MNNNTHNLTMQMLGCAARTNTIGGGVVVAIYNAVNASHQGGFFFMNMKS